MRIILASASPRRKELLAKLFAEFEIMAANGEEHCTKELPEDVVLELAGRKAYEAEQGLCGLHDDYLVIGADTAVACQGKILGKPKDENDAVNTLRMLSGNRHQVYTGVTAVLMQHGRRQCIHFCECTNVTFYPMSDAEIKDYVSSGEPMDKAGSYGIQGIGGRFVESIEGDYNNVVGLPVAKLYQELKSYLSY